MGLYYVYFTEFNIQLIKQLDFFKVMNSGPNFGRFCQLLDILICQFVYLITNMH